MKENINKYVGIPHRFMQSSFDGCDCLGLIKLFYREHGNPLEFDDGGFEITRDNYATLPVWRRLFRYLHKTCDKIENDGDIQFGDIIVFRINDCEHLAIAIDSYGRVLAMQVPEEEGKTTSMIYHRSLWKHVQHMIFRKKGGGIYGNISACAER